jgi:UDP-2,4-diacetamido-2,4,6-trideoxy-beta-L-altropyranose hydrolase
VNIVIRTDASLHIGSGHVMRCLVLAQGLTTQGHQVRFVCRSQPGDLITFIENKGFCVYQLAQAKTELIPVTSADYAAWLQVSWQQDVQDFLLQVDVADLVIVDHYALNADWQQRIGQALNCKIMVIDDLVRHHHADLILDQTLLRSSDEYQSDHHASHNTSDHTCHHTVHHTLHQTSHHTGQVLTGCDFALLNPQFSYYREQALANDVLSSRPRLLLSMGGIDQPNATFSVLTALADMPTLLRPLVTVLLGPRAPHYRQVKAFCLQHDDWIHHLDFVDNMAALMLQQQVAIGAPGTTSWERACLGLPSIIIPLAENQQTISRNLVAVDAAYKVERDEITEHLQRTYQALLQNWSRLRVNNLKLCDGLGLNRVLKAMADLVGVGDLQLRSATEADIKLVFDWQCHPSTRQYALTRQVPTWTEHNKWMRCKLLQQQDYFYIIAIADNTFSGVGVGVGADVGVVRLDKIAAAEYLLSIFIAPDYYNQGIAKRALASLDKLHPNITLHAQVLTANLASQKLFTQAGYQRLTAETFIRYPQD